MNRQVMSGDRFGNWILVGEPFRNVRGLVWRAQCRTDAAHSTTIPHRDIANEVTALIPSCAECAKAEEKKHQEDLQRHREYKRALAAWRPVEHFDALPVEGILED